MKICVYDILDYEEPILQRLERQLGGELVRVRQSLTADTLALAKGCGGISILGDSQVDRPLLEAMAREGIRHLSTRTIGYDHIDTAAAKALGVHVYHAHYAPNNVADFTVMMMLIMLRKARKRRIGMVGVGQDLAAKAAEVPDDGGADLAGADDADS